MTADNKIFVERLTEGQTDLLGFIASMLPHYPDDVSDVVQETNRALIEHAEDYNPEKPFKPWMFQFARFEIGHFIRSKKNARVLFDDETVGKSAEYLADESGRQDPKEGTLKRLAFCKKRLTDRQRKMLDLRYAQLCNTEEIARRMTEKPARVTFALVYIRRKLAECLQRLCRLSDEEFAEKHGDAFDELCGTLLDSALPQTKAAEKWLGLSECVKRDDSLLHRYLDQMSVHQVLSVEGKANGQASAISRERIRVPPWLWSAAAACAALALGTGAFLALPSFRGRRPVVVAAAMPKTEDREPEARKAVEAEPKTLAAETAATERESPAPAPKPTAALQKEGEREMKTATALAATVAASLALAPAAPLQAENSQTFSRVGSVTKGVIDTRDGSKTGAGNGTVETRDGDRRGAGVKKTIDTATPLGTVIMLI